MPERYVIFTSRQIEQTIHKIEPVGLGFGIPPGSAFERVFTAASPKSPILTVVPSVRNMLFVFRSLINEMIHFKSIITRTCELHYANEDNSFLAKSACIFQELFGFQIPLEAQLYVYVGRGSNLDTIELLLPILVRG